MKIGILGSGNVGGTLGRRWQKNGHAVTFSTRETIKQTAQAADVVVLATPWAPAREVLRTAGDLTGKILIDVLNPLLPDLSGLALGTNTSAGEMVAQWSPGAKVVKAFNTVGFNIMEDPKFGEDKALLFYCGDNAEAKKVVHGLAAELDFDPQDAGPLTQARQLEAFAMLWISLAFTPGHGRDFAFKMVKR